MLTPVPAGNSLVLFDVNQTLSDMRPMAERFREVGVPGVTAQVWFGAVLGDGFALASTGRQAPFAELAEQVARNLLDVPGRKGGLSDAVAHVMAGLAVLGVHPDVIDGVRELAATGVRLGTLTNGSVAATDNLLDGAGLREHFDVLLSVEDAGVWKPARRAYEYALVACRVPAAEVLFVAVHPWDTHGASLAGMRTVWLNRGASSYPPYFVQPTYEVASLRELAPLATSGS